MSEHEPIARVPRHPAPPPIPPTAPDPLVEAMDLLRGMYQAQQRTNELLHLCADRLEYLADTVRQDGCLAVHVTNP